MFAWKGTWKGIGTKVHRYVRVTAIKPQYDSRGEAVNPRRVVFSPNPACLEWHFAHWGKDLRRAGRHGPISGARTEAIRTRPVFSKHDLAARCAD